MRESTVRMTPPGSDGVGIAEITQPPENYLTVFVLRDLLSVLRTLDDDPSCRAIVVRSEGKHFCAGRDWTKVRDPQDTADAIYAAAPGFLELSTPWIAELTGGSIGVGMGLALCADYRVAAHTAYLWPKFVRLGIHHGFGLSATLPWLVGNQRATELLSLGHRISIPQAHQWGIVDRIATLDEIRTASHAFAADLASAPHEALVAIKDTMRSELRIQFASALTHEREAQQRLYASEDFQRETGGGYRYEA